MKIHIIDIKDISDFKVGNSENIDKGTGCTVIISEEGAIGGVDVRGGAPATRETDLLRSENTVNSINAVVLSGGSAYGLEAASGVMKELRDRGIGFETGYGKVPIVCGASLFDLSVGDNKIYPDLEMGREAAINAFDGNFDHGNRGAGTGASVGKFMGMNRAMKSGLGTFACADEYLEVGAIVAVNAMGDIYNGAGNIIAGLRSEDGSSIYGSIKSLKPLVHSVSDDSNTNNEEDYPNTSSEDIGNKNEIAKAIKNAFSNKIKTHAITEEPEQDIDNITDGGQIEDSVDNADRIYTSDTSDALDTSAITEGINSANGAADTESSTDLYSSDMMVTGHFSKDKIAEAGMQDNQYETHSSNDDASGYNQSSEESDDDLGYDISFNTTIACLITNAVMTKSQANKLASILHDAYARAIKPVHSTMDGDTIFVLTSGKAEINFDAFAALATDVLQYAIIDAATSAKSAYGLPAACDIIKK